MKPDWRQLLNTGWKEPKPMEYTLWVACAREYLDQNEVWRAHEIHARANYKSEHESAHVDFGGEA